MREYNLTPVLETFLYGVQLNLKTLWDLLKIRQWLEVAVLDEVIQAIGEAELSQLEGILAEWEARAAREESFSDLDEQFHRVLYSILDNQIMLQLSNVFWILNKQLRTSGQQNLQIGMGQQTVQEHRAILEAIRARDLARAQAAVRQSYAHGMAGLLALLDAGEA
ncbi:MAG: FadR family transcriptional regulator [Anaerolineae bacterium]|nr:FadR family transcriptional regulator [Anaerolineae bacterium]